MKVLGKNFTLYVLCLLTVIINFHSSFVECKKNCWMKFEGMKYFEAIDALNNKYKDVKKGFQVANGGSQMDKKMLVIMLKNRGISERALHAAQGIRNQIPAGINLGGYCQLMIADTVLFFHRLKLRNNTVFRVLKLKNDLANLQILAKIHLNDLHLFGSYDCTITHKPGYLFYEPTFGHVEILLKNVTYNMDGRYRLLKNRLNIEMVISEVYVEDVLVMYRNKNSTLTIKLKKKNIDVFLEKLKLDLDKWLKDYFNDYLMYFVVAEEPEFEKYYQEKTKVLNNYTSKVIDVVINRINQLKANAIQLPVFTINDSVDKEISLREGVLRGLETIYKRSITTDAKEDSISRIDTIVGFSSLKLSYRYVAILKTGFPPVKGTIILTADDLTAHMRLSLVKSPVAADLRFRFLEQTKPESLTVEGPANRVISNFKYLLERHIIAIMVNTLTLNINLLSTLDRCVPLFIPYNNGSMEVNNDEGNQETNPTNTETNSKESENNVTSPLPDPNSSQAENQPKAAVAVKFDYSDALADFSENENDNLSSNTKRRRGKMPLKKKYNKAIFNYNLKRNKRN